MTTPAEPFGRFARAITVALFLMAFSACAGESIEDRARDAAEDLQSAMQSGSTLALQQKVSPDEVKEAQEALTLAKEYMGEVNGVLDSVTVNAIQAFQRTHGLDDDGMLNDETKELLRQLKTQKAAS